MAPVREAKKKRFDRARYIPKRKVCSFCRDKVKDINYKDPVQLRPFISDRGKIQPRRKTGTCARHQRVLALAIKRARHIALLPYVSTHMHRTGSTASTDLVR